MLHVRQQQGFTFVEIIIVLAISSLLTSVAFAGQSAIRANARFTGAVDKLKNDTERVKGEALATVSNSPAANRGRNTKQSIFGKRMSFADGSSTVTVSTLIRNYDVIGNAGGVIESRDPYEIRLAGGVKFDGASGADTIVFVVQPSSGGIDTYAYSSASFTDVAYSSPASYSPSNSVVATPRTLQFRDADGRTAWLHVDTENSSITREFAK